MSHARTETEKVEAVTQFSNHLETARNKRQFYLDCTIQAKEELDRCNLNLDTGEPCSVDLHKVLYTFDFPQRILIPHLCIVNNNAFIDIVSHLGYRCCYNKAEKK